MRIGRKLFCENRPKVFCLVRIGLKFFIWWEEVKKIGENRLKVFCLVRIGWESFGLHTKPTWSAKYIHWRKVCTSFMPLLKANLFNIIQTRKETNLTRQIFSMYTVFRHCSDQIFQRYTNTDMRGGLFHISTILSESFLPGKKKRDAWPLSLYLSFPDYPDFLGHVQICLGFFFSSARREIWAS